jgi:hypothetical protein
MPGIGAAVYEVLAADTAVAAILGDRIYPADAVDETTSVPYAEYALTREDEDRDLAGVLRGYDAEVTVSFLTATYKQAQDLLREGRRTLNAMAGTHASKTIDAAQVTDGSDTPSGPIERDDQQTFQADLTVNLLYRE